MENDKTKKINMKTKTFIKQLNPLGMGIEELRISISINSPIIKELADKLYDKMDEIQEQYPNVIFEIRFAVKDI